MGVSKSKTQTADILRIFQEAAQTSFQFLITKFGFSLHSISTDDSMAFAGMIACDVRYRNTTTQVEISYTWYEDLRGTPQVICGRLNVNDEGSLEVEEAYNLDMIMSARCPDKTLEVHSDDPVDRLKETLSSYARILVDCAGNELTGNFSIFPRLRRTLLAELKGGVFLHSGVDAAELIEDLERESSE